MKVGNCEILAQHRFIIPSGQLAEFEFQYNDSTIKIVLELVLVPSRNLAHVKWVPIENGIKIAFTTISTSPVILRSDTPIGIMPDGVSLEFYAEVYRFGEFGVIFIQLMKGEKYA